MQLVVGVPHWAGACASVDDYAGAADSGLQVVTTADYDVCSELLQHLNLARTCAA